MASDDVSEMKVLTEKLSCDTLSENKKSLAALAKLTKKTENVVKLRRNGGLERLLEFIQRSNPKLTDMALSVLANCSLEMECRQEIRRLKGIAPLVLLLKNVAITSIQNRATRALANLAEDEVNAKEIESFEGIDELVKLLNETADKDCQQSLLRALRILCNTNMRKQIILNLDGIKTITSLLRSEKPAVVNCCIRAVAELTKDCSKDFAQQIQENEGIKAIVKICESDRPVMQHAAVLSLANLAAHSHVRVCIGSEGGIQLLYEHAKRNVPGHIATKAIEGLCFCCREAVNRIKVRETGALELLLKLFSSHEYKHLHRKLVLAFTCFYYDEPSLEILINGGIVAAVVTHLKTIISNVSAMDEDEDDLSDQMSFTSDFSSPTLSPRSASNSFAADVKELATNSESSELFLEKVETLANQIASKGNLAKQKTKNFKRKSKSRVSFSNELAIEGSLDMCTSHETLIIGTGDEMSFMEEKQTEGIYTSENFNGQDFCSSLTKNVNSTETPICSTPNRLFKDEILTEPLLISPLNQDQAALNSKPPSVSSNGTQRFNLLPSLPIKLDEMSQLSTLSSNHFALLSPIKPKSGSVFTSTVTAKRYPGHNSIVMLSRFSQMTDPSSFLINKSCINTLLDYMGFLPHPSPKCLRLLNRLTLNPLCFKSLVVSGMASAIHQQLICGYKSATHCMCYAVVPPDTLSHRDDVRITLGHLCCDAKRDCHCHWIPIPSHRSCLASGNQLLENLCTQAQTPYGKGVLVHLLQRGNSDERKGCVLTLPHICSTQNLRRELLGEREGLRMLIDHLCTDTDNEMLPAAVESLVILASSGNITTSCSTDDCLSGTGDVQGSSATDDVEDESGMYLFPSQELIKRAKSEAINRQTNINKNTELESTCQLPSKKFGACKYTSMSEGNFDLNFQLDSGELVPCHRHVLIKLSQVFCAMLSANYLEATEPRVRIQDVEHGVFSCAMHLLYGCRNCVTVCRNLSAESLPDDSDPGTESKSSDLPCLESQNKDVRAETESSVPRSSHLKFNFWIDLLAVADKFMLDSVKTFTEKQLILIIDTSTVVSACIHAKFHHSSAVVRFCLCYLLTKVPELCCRHRLFKELIVSKERKAIMEELYNLLSTCLK